MNAIVNKLLLAGDTLMPEMHLKQSGFTHSASDSFTKNKKRIKKVKETGNSSNIYQNTLDKICFQHDLAYGGFKDLNRRTAADKYYVIKHLKLLKIQNMIYDKYQCGLTSLVYNFF